MRWVDDLGFALGWIAPEHEALERASHALVDDGRVWLVEPIAGAGVLDRVRALGEPAGVIQLLDRHERDGPRLASELGVPLHRLPDGPIPGAPFTPVPLVDLPLWKERALWWLERRTLVVAEVLGTAPYYRAAGERLAVHPLVRVLPPRELLRFAPDHVLVGHGAGVHEDATGAVRDALGAARRRIPAWLRARAGR